MIAARRCLAGGRSWYAGCLIEMNLRHYPWQGLLLDDDGSEHDAVAGAEAVHDAGNAPCRGTAPVDIDSAPVQYSASE